MISHQQFSSVKTADKIATNNPITPIDEALRKVFATPQEETVLQKSSRIMGILAADITDEEMEAYVSEFQYLINEWLDEFEQIAFDGQTLKQAIAQE